MSGRPKETGISAAMYFDYCTGMSLDDVADKWGRSVDAVRRRFKDMGVPLRPRRYVRVAPAVNMSDLREANARRSRLANLRRVSEAEELLEVVADDSQRRALEARIAFPHATLTELGRLMDPPVSKDSVAGLLRRARGADQ